MNKCNVCGGSVRKMTDASFICEYCKQIYEASGDLMADEKIYNNAMALLNRGTIEGYERARELFGSIANYGDSYAQIYNCYSKIDETKIKQEEEKLKQERQKEQDRISEERKKERKKAFVKIGFALLCVVSIIITGTIIHIQNTRKEIAYNQAMALYEEKKYDDAQKIFEELNGYSESNEYVKKCKDDKLAQEYNIALELVKEEMYKDAVDAFVKLGSYRDSAEQIENCYKLTISKAVDLKKQKKYDAATELVQEIPSSAECYNDAQDVINIIIKEKNDDILQEAIKLFDEREYKDAQDLFLLLDGYGDSIIYLNTIGERVYEEAKILYENEDYVECVNRLLLINSEDKWNSYQVANELIDNAKNQYKETVTSEGVKVLRTQGFEEFSNYVKNAKNDIFSEADVNSLIKSYKPQQLLNVKTYAESGYIHVDKVWKPYTNGGSSSDRFTDNLDNTYSFGINRRIPNFSMEDSYLEYMVDDYNYLVGTIIVNYDFRSEEEPGYLVIYGDGNLIYTSPSICKGVNPIPISIDISSVKVMRIEITGNYPVLSLVEPMIIK